MPYVKQQVIPIHHPAAASSPNPAASMRICSAPPAAPPNGGGAGRVIALSMFAHPHGHARNAQLVAILERLAEEQPWVSGRGPKGGGVADDSWRPGVLAHPPCLRAAACTYMHASTLAGGGMFGRGCADPARFPVVCCASTVPAESRSWMLLTGGKWDYRGKPRETRIAVASSRRRLRPARPWRRAEVRIQGLIGGSSAVSCFYGPRAKSGVGKYHHSLTKCDNMLYLDLCTIPYPANLQTQQAPRPLDKREKKKKSTQPKKTANELRLVVQASLPPSAISTLRSRLRQCCVVVGFMKAFGAAPVPRLHMLCPPGRAPRL